MPAATRTSPAIMRSSEDLPAPLRPVTSSASPLLRLKLTPAEHLAAAALASQILAGELHQAGRPASGLGAENPEFPRIFGNNPGKSGVRHEKTL